MGLSYDPRKLREMLGVAPHAVYEPVAVFSLTFGTADGTEGPRTQGDGRPEQLSCWTMTRWARGWSWYKRTSHQTRRV
jgi:hypothetical protein